MSVLLLGHGSSFELDYLADAIEDAGSEPIRRAVPDWSGEPLTVTPGGDDLAVGSPLDYDALDGAYVDVRMLFRPKVTAHLDWFDVGTEDELVSALNRLSDFRSVFESLCRVLESRGITVLPRLHNHYLQERMAWQLDLFERAGLPVPDTVMTTDPDAAVTFCEEHDRVIYKPVTTNAAPAEVTEEDLTPERLAKLRNAPVQFQEFVPGDDLRVYVLDGEVIGAIRYESDRFSFKLDQKAGRSVDAQPASVASAIEDTATRAAELVDLTFGAADVRRRPDGGHALLELNQAPAFAAADEYADQNVTDAVAGYLIEGA